MNNLTKLITVHIGNYQGMRNTIKGKGRLEVTINSLLENVPPFRDLEVNIIDNFSSDGSWEFLRGLSFARVRREPRVDIEPNWLATTINNMNSIKSTVLKSDKKYVWNIENDSFFYNSNPFLDKAIEILETQHDLSIVHFRHWTEIDAKNSPGIPRNLSRVSEIRRAPSGFDFYVMEKRPEYAIWIPVTLDELGPNFKPDDNAEMGRCPIGIEKIGALRLIAAGDYERLLTEHWNTYTNHGWLARTSDIKFLFEEYNPLGERQLAVAFKKHFKAAKLDQDAFVDFGWRLKANPTEEEVLRLFEAVRKRNHSCILDYGNIGKQYEGSPFKIDEDRLDVYS